MVFRSPSLSALFPCPFRSETLPFYQSEGRREWGKSPSPLDLAGSSLAHCLSFSNKKKLLKKATARIRKNAAYFRVNYGLVIAGVTAAAMAVNPAALAVVAILGACWAWLFGVRTAPLVINGRQFSERETLVGAAAVSAVVVFFLTSVGTVLFTALGISVAAIAAHGATRVPDELFTDEIEGSSGGAGGLLGLLAGGGGGGAVQAAASRAVAAAV